MFKAYYLILFLILYSCTKKEKSVKFFQYKAVGNISRDTVFNGVIKFYDTSSNQLACEGTYNEGKLEGLYKEYYIHGPISEIRNYEKNKLNGEIKQFDSAGKLIRQEYYYYDLRVGPCINYKNDVPDKYTFLSLDNTPLLEIDYNLAKSKMITQVISDFFFFHKSEYSDAIRGDLSSQKNELFIYTPDPPNYNFRYSIVLLDSLKNIKKEVQNFNSKQPWSTFQFDPSLNSDFYAIRLLVKDSIAGGDITMFKYLKD